MGSKTYMKNLADACEDYIKLFGANKNLYRITPDMQSGLKPVQRRFLYTLYTGKGRREFIKMAKAANDTVAQFHPHAGTSVEEAGAALASPILNNVAPVEGYGNFGSYKNEKAGASRYITCRLSAYGMMCFFSDFEDSNVDMKLAYTGDSYEPEYLPARYPHALFNPQLAGIGYGLASNIPPFNVSEVLKATIKLIKNPDADIYLVPDSPTGADIVDDGQFEKINETGKGTFTLKGSLEIDEVANTITITSIPLQTTIDQIIKNIVLLREKKVFDEITDIKDYTSNKRGVRCVLYLNHTANPYKTAEKLYKKGTGLKKTYPVGITMVDDYVAYDYGVRSFLKEWIEYRRDTVRSSYNTKLVKAEEEKNMNDILIFIISKGYAAETLKLIKDSKDKKEVIEKLMKKLGINSQQAETIANMRMYQFNQESYQSYLEKDQELTKKISEYEHIIDDDDNEIDKIIISQLEEGIKLWGRPRQSKIVKEETVEDEVDTSEHILGITKDGIVKKVPLFEKQIGQVGDSTHQIMVVHANNSENILVFDSYGMVSRIPVNAIPDMKLDDIGVSLKRYSGFDGKAVSVILEPSKEELKKRGNNVNVTFLTKFGFVKQTPLKEYLGINGSMVSIKIPSEDELVSAELTLEGTSSDMVIYTNCGKGVRRSISQFPTSHANSRGNRQLQLGEVEHCVGFDIINPDKKYMLYVTSSGRCKLTELKYFPVMRKDEESISLISLEGGESLVGIRSVNQKDRAIIYKKKSEPEILEVSDVKISTRIAKGEKVIGNKRGDYVLSFSIITA